MEGADNTMQQNDLDRLNSQIQFLLYGKRQ